MAGYTLNSNTTLSFLKFDKATNRLYDSMSNSLMTWSVQGRIEDGGTSIASSPEFVNSKYYSRKYSFKSDYYYYKDPSSGNMKAKNQYLLSKLPFNCVDHNLVSTLASGNDYDLSFDSGSLSIDFWVYIPNGTYYLRPLFIIHRNSNKDLPDRVTTTRFYKTEEIAVYLTNKTGLINTTKNNVGISTVSEVIPCSSNNFMSTGPTVFRYSTYNDSSTLQYGNWNHIYFGRTFNTFYLGVNGDVKTITGNGNVTGILTDGVVWLGSTIVGDAFKSLGYFGAESSYNMWATGKVYNDQFISNGRQTYINELYHGIETNQTTLYFDNVRISNDILWTENFTPPTAMTNKQIFIYDDYAYYNDINNDVVKLSFAKWKDISISDKLILLDKVNSNDLPSVDKIKLVQTDPSKEIQCINYQYNGVPLQTSIDIIKIDESQSEIVYPTKLMDYSALQANLVSIFASGSTVSTSSIRLAVTRDMETYYTYNMTNNAWVPLDNKYDVKTDGILLSALKDIPKAAWIQFDLSKFAFSISLTKTYEADACQIDDIKLKVNLDSKWVKSIKGTQSKYQYVGATLLKVTFLEDGKYKVNYNDRG